MHHTDLLGRGRAAFERQEWSETHARLAEADGEQALPPDDLERLAIAAYLLGRATEATDTLARAFRAQTDREDSESAARCAFWLGFIFMERGEHAPAAGWLSRAERLLDETQHDSVVRGYLLLPNALSKTGSDPRAAYGLFAEAAEVGRRFHDVDLATLARHGQGRALIRLGETERGIALLDELMAAVTSGEVSPITAGVVYCSVISACYDMFDLRRAQEWTAALARWCASQPDLVPFRGQCLVRRSQIMQLHGEWQDALIEAQRACARLSDPPGQTDAGVAFYQEAELHRLRGEFAEAEEAYRLAHQHGRKPQPGLALLRLAQGDVSAARTAIGRALEEARDRRTRATTIPAFVEIALAAKDVAGARAAAEDLTAIAADIDTVFLKAVSAWAVGAVLLEEGQPREALNSLRAASAHWKTLDAPYQVARVRVRIGRACRVLGDDDTAALEFDAARRAFEDLGAQPDLAALRALTTTANRGAPGGLTRRELEVLRLVAAGKTNRAIAGDLRISEKTVARHVSNIFTKLGVSSRAAATAYAYEHGLV